MSDGELTQQRLENDPEQPEQFFAQVPRGARIAIEASGTWWWFVDLVELKKQHDEEREPNQLVLEGRLALQPRTRRADAPKRDGRPLGPATPNDGAGTAQRGATGIRRICRDDCPSFSLDRGRMAVYSEVRGPLFVSRVRPVCPGPYRRS
jgi:hypothetical protein